MPGLLICRGGKGERERNKKLRGEEEGGGRNSRGKGRSKRGWVGGGKNGICSRGEMNSFLAGFLYPHRHRKDWTGCLNSCQGRDVNSYGN